MCTNGNLVSGVWGLVAERCHVARLEVDSSVPDTVGPQERQRTEGPAAGWHDGCHMLVRSAGNEATESCSREGKGRGVVAQKKGLTSKTM